MIIVMMMMMIIIIIIIIIIHPVPLFQYFSSLRQLRKLGPRIRYTHTQTNTHTIKKVQ
jgi:hypothetical protein